MEFLFLWTIDTRTYVVANVAFTSIYLEEVNVFEELWSLMRCFRTLLLLAFLGTKLKIYQSIANDVGNEIYISFL